MQKLNHHVLKSNKKGLVAQQHNDTYPLLISTGFLKFPLELEKKIQLVCTEFLSQFEMNGEMEISKNQ